MHFLKNYVNLSNLLFEKMQKLYKKISDELRKILNSKWFNYCINLLTIIDCLSVIIVLIIEYIELSMINKDYMKITKLIIQASKRTNKTAFLDLDETLANLEYYNPNVSDFKVAYQILTTVILTILGFFILEIIIKLIFLPKIFTERKFEIAEALIIVISFILNLSLLFEKVQVLSVISLITLIR